MVEAHEDFIIKMLDKILLPQDYLMLEFGVSENQKIRLDTLSRFIKIFSKYPNTLIGKWSAARLGLESYKDYLETITSDKTNNQSLSSVQAELLMKSIAYLENARKLPDAIPVREEVLYKLGRIESLKGNQKNAKAIFQELSNKYPFGKYGRIISKEHISLLQNSTK